MGITLTNKCIQGACDKVIAFWFLVFRWCRRRRHRRFRLIQNLCDLLAIPRKFYWIDSFIAATIDVVILLLFPNRQSFDFLKAPNDSKTENNSIFVALKWFANDSTEIGRCHYRNCKLCVRCLCDCCIQRLAVRAIYILHVTMELKMTFADCVKFSCPEPCMPFLASISIGNWARFSI